MLSDSFCVYCGLLSWWKIQTWPVIRFLTEAVRFWFCICWCLIESMMPCIWTRSSGPPAEKHAHSIKDPAVYLTVDMGYLLSLFALNSSGGFVAKKQFFQFHLTIEASAIWSSSCVWQLNLLEFVFGWLRRIFLETLPNNICWCRQGRIKTALGPGAMTYCRAPPITITIYCIYSFSFKQDFLIPYKILDALKFHNFFYQFQYHKR